MKRSLLALILVLGLLITLIAGCSKSEQQANDNSFAGTGNFRGNFNQNPADVYGEVKSVSGNEVNIALLEMPQRRQLTDEEKKKLQEQRQNSQNSNNNQQQQGSGGQAQGGQNSSSGIQRNGGQGRGGFGGGFGGQRTYTGETLKLTIPDSIAIKTFSRGNQGFKEEDVKLSDVKAGDIIQVWYKKDSQTKEIDSIRIMQNRAPQSGSNQQQTGN